MITETVEIKGLEELRAKLHALPLDMRKKVMRQAVGAGAKIVKERAVARTPISSSPRKRAGLVIPPGTLRAAALINFRKRDSDDAKVIYIVTYRQGKRQQARIKGGKQTANKDAYYARWVEFGHKIVPRLSRKSMLRGQITRASRRRNAGRQVAGRHFLRDAFAETWQTALDKIRSVMAMYFAKPKI